MKHDDLTLFACVFRMLNEDEWQTDNDNSSYDTDSSSSQLVVGRCQPTSSTTTGHQCLDKSLIECQKWIQVNTNPDLIPIR